LQSEINAILPPRRTKRPRDSTDAPASKRQCANPDDEDNKDDEDDEDDGDQEDEGKDAGDSDIEFIGINHPITTSGIKVSTVRSLVIDAIKMHPSSIKYVEALRPTVVDGLSDEHLRLALVQIAQKHADVVAVMAQQRKEENSAILKFTADVIKAKRVIHSLDRLRESQKFERSDEVGARSC